MKNRITLFAVILAATLLHAGENSDRFIKKIELSSDLTAVVAEGDFEARSIGSFSVRLYSTENAQPGDDTTFFVTGVINERDGYIEKVVLVDVDGDGRDEIVVIIRSVGTGQYLSADAFAVDKKRLLLRASIAGLASDADPIAALKKAKVKKK